MRRTALTLVALLAIGCLRAEAREETFLPDAWWPAAMPRDRWFPVGALVLPGGEIVVAERYQNRIFRFERPDKEPLRLPSPSPEPVEWTAICAGPGLAFYALDGPGRAVHQYDLQGNYQGLALDVEALAEAEGLVGVEPAGLAVDRTGHAVVTDRNGDRLLEFGPGWTFLGVWGQGGDAPGSWRRPGAIAVGKKAPFFVADEGNSRVVLVDEFGGTLATRVLPRSPSGVAVLGVGLYGAAFADTVIVLDAALDSVASVRLPSIVEGCDKRPFTTSALAGDAGTLYVGEGCSGRVVRFRRRGE